MQARTLDAIRSLSASLGRSPSLREIGDAIDRPHTAAYRILVALERYGVVRRLDDVDPARSRQVVRRIEIVGEVG